MNGHNERDKHFESNDKYFKMEQQRLLEEPLISSLESLYEYAKQTEKFKTHFANNTLAPDRSIKIQLSDGHLIQVKLFQSEQPLDPDTQISSLSLDSYNSYEKTEAGELPSSPLFKVEYLDDVPMVQLYEEPRIILAELEELSTKWISRPNHF